MLIPIGHESSEVRRLPWVTISIIAACAVLLYHTESRMRSLFTPLLRAAADAQEFFWSHPYLELDPEVEEILFPELATDAGEARLFELLDQTREPFSWVKLEQQTEFDHLTAEFMELFESLPYRRLGINPSQQTMSGWFTHMFTHAGFVHLLGNMLLLFLAGSCIEDVWGRPLYLLFYVASGLFAAGFWIFMYPDLDMPLVGASGAVSGVLGAFLVRYGSTRIRFFYWFLFLFRGTFSAPAWLMLPLWFGNELLSGWAMDALMPGSGGGGVAHWAHVGGFGFGVALALGMKGLRIEERFLHESLESKVTFVANRAIEEAHRAREAGSPEVGFELLSEELRRDPDNYDATLAFWDIAHELGRAADAGPALARVIRHDVQAGELDRALERLQELDRRSPETVLEPLVLLRLGTALAREARMEAAALALRKAVPEGVELPTALALRIARTAREVDPDTAGRAARIALASPELDPMDRDGLEALIRELGPGARDPLDVGTELDAPDGEAPVRAADEVASPFESASTFDLGGADAEADLARGSGLELDDAPGQDTRLLSPTPPGARDLDLDPGGAPSPGQDATQVLSDDELQPLRAAAGPGSLAPEATQVFEGPRAAEPPGAEAPSPDQTQLLVSKGEREPGSLDETVLQIERDLGDDEGGAGFLQPADPEEKDEG